MTHKEYLELLIGPLANEGGGGGTPAVLIDKSVSANGTYEAVNDNADGYKKVVVAVQPDLQSKSVTIQQNGSTTVSPDQGKDGLSGVEITVAVPTSGSPDDFIDQYVGHTLTGALSSSAVTTIEDYGLYNQSHITGVNFPNCTAVGERGFYGCSGLLSIHLPECTNLKTYNLYRCSSLKELILEKCTTIGTNQFDTNAQLLIEKVSIPLLKTMNWGTGNFRYLKELNAPKVESIANNNIRGQNASNKNAAMKVVKLPKIKSLGSGIFQYFAALQAVKFGPDLASIGGAVCQYNTVLQAVIFDEDTAAVPALSASSSFGGSSNAKFYVPDAMLTDWQGASLWSSMASRIRGLSEIQDWVSGTTYLNNHTIVKRNGGYYISQASDVSTDPAVDDVNWLYIGAV
jgi:hypothetical protein